MFSTLLNGSLNPSSIHSLRKKRSSFARVCFWVVVPGFWGFSLPLSAQVEMMVEDATPAPEESPVDPLVARSPFLPDGFNAEARQENRRPERNTQGPLAQRFEFRGYYQLNGEYRFLIREKNKTAGRWVRLNDPEAAYLVDQFDETSGQIQLNQDGQTEMIALISLDTNAAPMPVSGAPPAVSPTNPGTNAGNVAQARRNDAPIPPGATPLPPRPATSRRTPPPPPQWLQNRLAERGVDAAAITREIEAGPPNFIPPPPPTTAPPGAPPTGDPGNGDSSEPPPAPSTSNPPSGGVPNLPSDFTIPGAPPNFIPPPPPGG